MNIIKHYWSWQMSWTSSDYSFMYILCGWITWWKYVEKKKQKKCIEFICYHLINRIGQWHFHNPRCIWNHTLFNGERWSRWIIFNKGPVYYSIEGNCEVVILLMCNLILRNLLIHHFHNIKNIYSTSQLFRNNFTSNSWLLFHYLLISASKEKRKQINTWKFAFIIGPFFGIPGEKLW